MKIQAIQTHLVSAGESLFDLLDKYLPALSEKSIVAVTSKVVSLCEKRVLAKTRSKEELVKQEADLYLQEVNSHGILLTFKNHFLIPSAGIDESNGNGLYILYPEDVFRSASEIWHHLKKRHGLKELGVILTDSHTTPSRWGVTGMAIGWCGVQPLNNYIGTPDCHGHHLHYTKVNVVDALATAAVFTMGEGNEQTPLALITELSKVSFVELPPTREEVESLHIPLDQDLYGPLLAKGTWIEGNGALSKS